MKNKLIAVLAFASASLFAFAEAPAENAAPEKAKNCPAQRCAKEGKCVKHDKCDKGPKCAKDAKALHRVHLKRVLLSLDDEALAKLAEEIAAVRAMTPEQRAEAAAKLPKPEFRGAPRGERRDDVRRPGAPRPEGKCEACGDKPGKEARGPHAPRGERPGKGPRGPKGGKGLAEGEALPPPPAEEAVAE